MKKYIIGLGLVASIAIASVALASPDGLRCVLQVSPSQAVIGTTIPVTVTVAGNGTSGGFVSNTLIQSGYNQFTLTLPNSEGTCSGFVIGIARHVGP